MSHTLVVVGCFAAWSVAAAPANAGHMTSLNSGEDASASMIPGETAVLRIAISNDALETRSPAFARVMFDAPGLKYMGHMWANPYLNDTPNGGSKPLDGLLPVALLDLTRSGVGDHADVVDVERSNGLPVGSNFGAGIMASTARRVPATNAVALAPGQITLNGEDDSTRVAGFFTLIVPTPSVSAVGYFVAVFGMLNRRRSR